MFEMAAKQITVAAVQMACQPGRVDENLEHATHLIELAVQRGAQLVLLPELMPSGYQLTEALWDCAEPFNGRTVDWLTSLAQRLRVYLGTTLLEAAGQDFFNTFALATPDGTLAGRVRKSPPASLEAYFYRAGNDTHVIDTALGRIGVGICYENLLYARLRDLYYASVDLVLQPAAAGRPKPFIAGDLERFDRMVEGIPRHYARGLGVPVVLANQSGPLHTALPGGAGELVSSFPGLSTIVDSDGAVQAALGAEEGVIVGDVRPDPERKTRAVPGRFRGRWGVPVPWYAFIWPLTQRQGKRAYAQNAERKARATLMSRLALTPAS
jgi:N-carbamoylputrescine amidase